MPTREHRGSKRPGPTWRYGLRDQAFERFGELLELGLVQERDLELARAHACGEAGDAFGGLSHARGERWVDLRDLARLGLRARPAGGPLGCAHRHPAPDDLAREPAA